MARRRKGGAAGASGTVALAEAAAAPAPEPGGPVRMSIREAGRDAVVRKAVRLQAWWRGFRVRQRVWLEEQATLRDVDAIFGTRVQLTRAERREVCRNAARCGRRDGARRR